ncbi:cytochrome b/b6 domain-containing protein [Telmatospirillum sp.]|uniref:cytochrome b/b6 domain-containing protein n=1 Tax=Telmatospirillum sp. TaxID=2079197 RepID=UPI00284F3B83|nr:cytochrome b/b6 domain-containing protein [Telmatospirillum sp.]MDR3438022.1 cytochrome b/b6 domain-containing protein [Telmatospirillum sp.]
MNKIYSRVILAVMAMVFANPSPSGAADPSSQAVALSPTADWRSLPPLVRNHQERQPYSLGPVDPARADQIKAINAGCLSCHSAEGAQNPPRPDVDRAKLATMVVSLAASSVHAGQACTSCHGDGVARYPHPETVKQQTRTCVDCHPRSAKYVLPAFEDSRHFLRHKAEFTCAACHDPHTMVRAGTLTSPHMVAAADNAKCLDCHQNEAKFARFSSARKMPDLAVHHNWLPNATLHWASVRCIDCHAEANESGYSHQFVRIVKATRDCSSCHTTDSSLRSRLYRKALGQPLVSPAGFVNPVILAEAYVVGATRNVWLDQAILAVGALLLAGLLLHALVRLASPARARHPAATGHRVYLFASWLRLWHWSNVVLMGLLALTGFSLHFARPDAAMVPFAPAHQIHVAAGIVLCVAFAAFLVGNAVTGNWRQFVPRLAGLPGRLVAQTRFYLWDIFRGGAHPFPTTPDNTFNPLQQIIYALVMYGACPLLLGSGVLLLFPELLDGKILDLDATLAVATLHYLAASAIVLFTLSHIYLATTGTTVLAYLKSMVTGWHQD